MVSPIRAVIVTLADPKLRPATVTDLSAFALHTIVFAGEIDVETGASYVNGVEIVPTKFATVVETGSAAALPTLVSAGPCIRRTVLADHATVKPVPPLRKLEGV